MDAIIAPKIVVKRQPNLLVTADATGPKPSVKPVNNEITIDAFAFVASNSWKFQKKIKILQVYDKER